MNIDKLEGVIFDCTCDHSDVQVYKKGLLHGIVCMGCGLMVADLNEFDVAAENWNSLQEKRAIES